MGSGYPSQGDRSSLRGVVGGVDRDPSTGRFLERSVIAKQPCAWEHYLETCGSCRYSSCSSSSAFPGQVSPPWLPRTILTSRDTRRRFWNRSSKPGPIPCG